MVPNSEETTTPATEEVATPTVEITTVPYTMEVPKEGMEVINAVSLLITHFVGGGSIMGAAQHLDELKDAVVGAGEVIHEAKSQYKDELAGYTVHKIWGAFDK